MPQASTLQACRALFKVLQALCCCSLDPFRGQDSTRTSSSDSSVRHTAQGYNQTRSTRADCWTGDDWCHSGEAVPCPVRVRMGGQLTLANSALQVCSTECPVDLSLLHCSHPKLLPPPKIIEGHVARLYIQVALYSLQRERASLHFIQGQALHPPVV